MRSLPANTKHLTSLYKVGPTLFKCYTNVSRLLGTEIIVNL